MINHIVIINLVNLINSDTIRLTELFSYKNIQITKDEILEILDNLYSLLSSTFVINVNELDNEINLDLISHSHEYSFSLQACVDKFIYDCWQKGLQLELEQARKFIQFSELAMIDCVCESYPYFDEEKMIVSSSEYKKNFQFHLNFSSV